MKSALVVGIDEYEYLSPLGQAVRDANEIACWEKQQIERVW